MRALLIICLFPFVEFCMGKGRTFCGDGQRLAATFASLACPPRLRLCGKGRGEGLPAAPHPEGKRRAVRWAMQRAAMADGACCAGLYSVLPSGVRKTPFPIGRACSPVLTCLQSCLGRACSLALKRPTVVCVACGKLASEGLRARVIIFHETLLRSSFFPAKVKKTWPIVLCYARLALPLQK